VTTGSGATTILGAAAAFGAATVRIALAATLDAATGRGTLRATVCSRLAVDARRVGAAE
jgi:hypothetical protein